MKAPEKIYYAPYGDMRVNDPITENDIEYIRADAFIEKAAKWIEHNFGKYDSNSSFEKEMFVGEFIKAMKGE